MNELQKLDTLDPTNLIHEMRALHRAVCDHSVTDWSIEATPNTSQPGQFRHFVLRVDVRYDGGGTHAKRSLGFISQAEHDVLDERREQVEKWGTTLDRDVKYQNGELRQAAIAYVCGGGVEWTKRPINSPTQVSITGGEMWPFDLDTFKCAPAGDWEARRHDMVKAAAFILAEIERLDAKRALKVGANG